jgi:hypothetical protein
VRKSLVILIALFIGSSAWGTDGSGAARELDSGHAKAINLSLIPDVAIFKRTEKIRGFTLSIWGENEQQSLALGLINGSTGNSSGLSLGFIVNYADNYTGAELALFNWVKKNFVGFEAGFVNYVAGHVTGFQWGLVNYAGTLKGLQLGLINYAHNVESGLQIGFVNVIPETHEWFKRFPHAVAPFMIVANWRL